MKKVYFDIANSVKGGSGKSTFSLLLAAACSMKKGAQAYILDLDLRGTSWESNYGDCFFNSSFCGDEHTPLRNLSDSKEKEKMQKYENYPFINALMWSFPKYKGKNNWTDLRLSFEKTTNEFLTYSVIKLCPAKAKNGNDIDKVEIDIFENGIKQIIISVMEQLSSDESTTELHFILDMPPSYEKHAERIINHLLTSEASDFFQLSKNHTGVFEAFEAFEVNLYMVCAAAPAHVIQNSLYVSALINKPNYSVSVHRLIKNGKLKIYYILNDISGNLDYTIKKLCLPNQNLVDTFSSSLNTNDVIFKENIEKLSRLNDFYSSPVNYLIIIPQLKLNATAWFFGCEKNADGLLALYDETDTNEAKEEIKKMLVFWENRDE